MNLLSYLLDVLFPRTCPICHKALPRDLYVCSDCLAQFDRTEQAFNRDNETEKYFAGKKHFAWGGCWLHYVKRSYLQHIIHQAKYNRGNPRLLQQLGRQAAQEWQETGFFDGIDVMIPIPLHKDRKRLRGFNQSDYIVRGMQEVLNIPMNTEYLTRDKATKKQSQSTYSERQHGVEGAFRIHYPEELYGKTILLVDDIITTGATIRSAMAAFDEVYGCKIVVFALAKTK